MKCSWCSELFVGWLYVCSLTAAMNSITSAACKYGLICKISREPDSQTSRTRNDKATANDLAVALQDSRGSHSHMLWCQWCPLGLIKLQSSESKSSWTTFWVTSSLAFIFSILLHPFLRPVEGFYVFVLGCWHYIVLYSSGWARLCGTNQPPQNLRGVNNKGLFLSHSSDPLLGSWAVL